jgi:hypothetical protein
MKRTTDQLIAELAREASPVRRLQTPLRRALLWLLVVAVVAGAGVWLKADLWVFVARAANVRMAIELAATLATGVLGVIAAFHLSIPDRPRSWILAPLPPLALWLGASGYECWKNWITRTDDGWAVGESAMCFMFILGVGGALGLLLYWPIRRARPIDPGGVVMAGGLGVAGLASFILQFFHPFDVTFMDLGWHLAAIAVLLGASWLLGRRGLGPA